MSKSRPFILTGLMLCGARAAIGDPAGVEFFERNVRPVFVSHCLKCHGETKQESDLRLDSADSAQRGGVYGPAVVPGKPDESTLISAVSYENEDLQMPPKGRLSDAEIASLREWIQMGAPWPNEDDANSVRPFDIADRKASHWAWRSVRQPDVPSVNDAQWPQGEIDHFILSRLEQRGLNPAPDADRRTLIRRAYLDLTGLLPTPAEVNQFLADESPRAWERVIDRLLASPQFGERWARHWFDLVRFAETYGHEGDYAIPYAWQYRDYVIRALNADVPYDQFVMEHIAGDLLAPPRMNPTEGYNESIIATGFWFMYEQTHAPTDIRQHEADRVDNQIDVMSKAFLGMTVGCARCHDHKFDAISTRDYYALAGYLKSSRQQIALLESRGEISAGAAKLQELRATVTKMLGDVVPQPAEVKGQGFAKWLLATAKVDNGQTAIDVAAKRGLDVDRLGRWSKALEHVPAEPSHPLYTWQQFKSSQPDNSAVQGTVRQVRDALSKRDSESRHKWLVKRGSHDPFAHWFITGWAFRAAAAESAVWDSSSKPLAVTLPGTLDSGAFGNKLEGTAQSPTFVISAPQIHMRARGKGRVRLIVDNYMMDEVHKLLFDGLILDVDTGDSFKWITIKGDLGKYIGERGYISIEDNGPGRIVVDEIAFADGPPPNAAPSTLLLTECETGTINSLDALAAAYEKAWNKTVSQWHVGNLDAAHAELLNWVLQNELIGNSQLALKISELRLEIEQAEESLPAPMKVLAIGDGSGRDEQIYLRGKYQNLGDVVPRRFLEAIDGAEEFSDESGSGRLQLARKFVAPTNPLFARTAVNRTWHHLFGRGIVATVDNFGIQGESPTHPELLDWLASEFASDGWSQKGLIRRLMLSRTYQMTSRPADDTSEQQDPANLLWHRAKVKRLEGEAIRDCLLSVSGQLNSTMFGPSVPAYLSPFSESKFQPKVSGPLDGDGRRSIYLEVRRNNLPSMLVVFDTPTPFTTVGRRNASNVPAQALAMLNDPIVTKLAHQWAKRVLTEHADREPAERITRMYESALCRPPIQSETTAAVQFIQRQGELLGVPATNRDDDVNIWADFAHVLFNHKEFVLRN